MRIVLQCRVRTSAIKKTSRREYWVINNPADIRPCEESHGLAAAAAAAPAGQLRSLITCLTAFLFLDAP